MHTSTQEDTKCPLRCTDYRKDSPQHCAGSPLPECRTLLQKHASSCQGCLSSSAHLKETQKVLKPTRNTSSHSSFRQSFGIPLSDPLQEHLLPVLNTSHSSHSLSWVMEVSHCPKGKNQKVFPMLNNACLEVQLPSTVCLQQTWSFCFQMLTEVLFPLNKELPLPQPPPLVCLILYLKAVNIPSYCLCQMNQKSYLKLVKLNGVT